MHEREVGAGMNEEREGEMEGEGEGEGESWHKTDWFLTARFFAVI